MKISTLIPVFAASTLLSGCAGGLGPSIGDYGPGSDTAMLNRNRGRSDALVTKDQYDQYRRQQDIASHELDLEAKKSGTIRENIRTVFDGVGVISGILR